MPQLPDARETAFLALQAWEKSGTFTDQYLSAALAKNRLSPRDAALAVRMTGGVLQNLALCDFYIAHYSSVPLARMQRSVRNILRLGVYQIVFLDRIPHSAAVNEAVKLTRKHAGPRATGLVNAVLRAVSRDADALPEPIFPSEEETLAVRYSHPVWLVRELVQRLGGEEARLFLAADNEPVPLFLQVNTLRSDADTVLRSLRADGAEAAAHPWMPDCLVCSGTGNPEQLSSFRDGLIYVQDPSAGCAVLAAAPQTGAQILDACAAPGGKSFAAAIRTGGGGDVLACDIHEKKIAQIRAGAQRLGLSNIRAMESDGRVRKHEWDEQFDLVIADVPCSGFGTIRKKPDIRYKDPNAIEPLPEVQNALIETLSYSVRPGGTLLYSTCTILERENEAVVGRFLQRHPDFVPEAFTLPGPAGTVDGGMITLWPHIHGTDGFFIAKLRRQGSAT